MAHSFYPLCPPFQPAKDWKAPRRREWDPLEDPRYDGRVEAAIVKKQMQPKIYEQFLPKHTSYVLGFMFNPLTSKVVLIQKRDTHKLNGVGGKIEPPESPEGAMIREFYEETGVFTSETMWQAFCIFNDENWMVHCFKSLGNPLYKHAFTRTDEQVAVIPLMDITPENPDIDDTAKWLIPMALDSRLKFANGSY